MRKSFSGGAPRQAKVAKEAFESKERTLRRKAARLITSQAESKLKAISLKVAKLSLRPVSLSLRLRPVRSKFGLKSAARSKLGLKSARMRHDGIAAERSARPNVESAETLGGIRFEKWQACGNDFILTETEGLDEVAVCDRHFGIGADGVIYVLKSSTAEAKMKIVNSDGTEAEMCGNGIRCVGQYVAEKTGQNQLQIETKAGLKAISLDPAASLVKVEMGTAAYRWRREIAVADRSYDASFVEIGNPHCVLFVEEVHGGEVERFGKKIEQNERLFPNRTNVEFVTVETRTKIRVRVWERGCGRTLACGTGACASAYAAYVRGLVESKLEVELDGGTLQIEIEALAREEAGSEPLAALTMKGPAERVYRGQL